MITYEHFSIKWESDGVDLLKDLMFKSCTVDFIHRSIPKVSMVVSTVKPEDVVSKVDTTVTIILDNNTSLKFPFFVFQRNFETEDIVLTGFIGTSDFMKTTRSAYLGSDLNSALNKVKGEFNINFSTSVSGEFYQFNETDCQCLLRLLRGCSDSKSFEFTNDSVELIDDSESFELTNGKRTAIDFNFVSENTSDPVIEENEDYYTQGWNKSQVYESSSSQFIKNVLSTIKYERAYDIIITMLYSGVPSGIVGGKAKISFVDLTCTNWTIIGKIIKVSSINGSVSTEVIIGANK